MKREIRALAETKYDVAIIGGGIFGAASCCGLPSPMWSRA